jgi:hypothetical protein
VNRASSNRLEKLSWEKISHGKTFIHFSYKHERNFIPHSVSIISSRVKHIGEHKKDPCIRACEKRSRREEKKEKSMPSAQLDFHFIRFSLII